VGGWQETLGSVLVHLEACLDFPEEELELAGREELIRTLAAIATAMEGKLDSFAWGRTAREGFRVAILGAPNVGKSRLLNRLAEGEHAIVSPHAGTTRDAIEVRVNVFGTFVRVIDTAGLRRTGDPVEEEGVLRARRAAAAADLVLFVFDGLREIDPAEAEEALALAREREGGVLAVMNKVDEGRVPEASLRDLFGTEPQAVSAATGEGIEELMRRIRDHAWSGRGPRESGPLTRLRHREAVAAARECLENARGLLAEGTALDAAASELQGARRHLNGLLGWGTPEEVLDRIFSEFCIGK
jgi:tRNA modification GTPase